MGMELTNSTVEKARANKGSAPRSISVMKTETQQIPQREVDLVEDLLEVGHVVDVVDEHGSLSEEGHAAGGSADALNLTTGNGGAHHGARTLPQRHRKRLSGQGCLIALHGLSSQQLAVGRHGTASA